jgi:prevent-host-death family protein
VLERFLFPRMMLTWPHGHGYPYVMKSIAAGKFKDVCLKTLDDVAATKASVVITKRGRPVAKLVPYVEPAKKRGLAGSVVKEAGDPFATGERWDADAS